MARDCKHLTRIIRVEYKANSPINCDLDTIELICVNCSKQWELDSYEKDCLSFVFGKNWGK